MGRRRKAVPVKKWSPRIVPPQAPKVIPARGPYWR